MTPKASLTPEIPELSAMAWFAVIVAHKPFVNCRPLIIGGPFEMARLLPAPAAFPGISNWYVAMMPLAEVAPVVFNDGTVALSHSFKKRCTALLLPSEKNINWQACPLICCQIALPLAFDVSVLSWKPTIPPSGPSAMTYLPFTTTMAKANTPYSPKPTS